MSGLGVVVVMFTLLPVNNAWSLDNPEKVIEETCARECGLIILVCGPPVSSNRIASSRNPARLLLIPAFNTRISRSSRNAVKRIGLTMYECDYSANSRKCEPFRNCKVLHRRASACKTTRLRSRNAPRTFLMIIVCGRGAWTSRSRRNAGIRNRSTGARLNDQPDDSPGPATNSAVGGICLRRSARI
jgi:hypothetical protein